MAPKRSVYEYALKIERFYCSLWTIRSLILVHGLVDSNPPFLIGSKECYYVVSC